MGDVVQFKPTKLQELIATKTIIENICDWNAARYDQELNHDLTHALLKEEIDETDLAFHQDNKLAILDGMGDVFFVAIGALWKSGRSAAQVEEFLDALEREFPIIPPISVCFHWYTLTHEEFPIGLLALSILYKLEYLLGNDNLALDVIRAICDSNNTKSVAKTESHIKANVDKGETYIPPTEALQAILDKVLS